MTAQEIVDYFEEMSWLARIRPVEGKCTVVFKVHPSVMKEVIRDMEDRRPVGITFIYKRLNIWDYWCLRNQAVEIRKYGKISSFFFRPQAQISA